MAHKTFKKGNNMELRKKTLEKLRMLINEETKYRSGPELVNFFNELGFMDSYAWSGGFPSRWKYTDSKLEIINGKPELDLCIRNLFSPINYIDDIAKLEELIKDFNNYLAFDGWKIVIDGKEISFQRTDKIEILSQIGKKKDISEDDFLKKEFDSIPTSKLGIDPVALSIIESRIEEIKLTMNEKASLASIIMCGSTLEGALLGIALLSPEKFNRSSMAPKDKDGKVKTFQNWTLSNFIDVACDIDLIQEDIKKFSHSLRDFRNYIHPYEQLANNFNPNEHTAMICFQVLKAAIFQLAKVK
jgi:hypothetical protein